MRLVRFGLTVGLIGLFAAPVSAQTEPITCFGRAVTILGTDAKDQLYGTPGHDVMHALGEFDYVRGATAQGQPDVKDWICGGAGPDSLHGDYGNDWIDGEQGEDYIVGEDGQDRLFGGAGNDEISPHWGSDFVDGGEGADIIRNGHDKGVRWSSDIIHGGEGGDIIEAESSTGSDALYGDAGNDEINGRDWGYEPSSTPDLVDGGPGKDTCVADADDTVVNCEEVTIVV